MFVIRVKFNTLQNYITLFQSQSLWQNRQVCATVFDLYCTSIRSLFCWVLNNQNGKSVASGDAPVSKSCLVASERSWSWSRRQLTLSSWPCAGDQNQEGRVSCIWSRSRWWLVEVGGGDFDQVWSRRRCLHLQVPLEWLQWSRPPADPPLNSSKRHKACGSQILSFLISRMPTREPRSHIKWDVAAVLWNIHQVESWN